MTGLAGWHYLLLGGLLEIVWAISTKARPWWTLYISIGAGAGSVSCLYAALDTMPIGTSYAVDRNRSGWVGTRRHHPLWRECVGAPTRIAYLSYSRPNRDWPLKPVEGRVLPMFIGFVVRNSRTSVAQPTSCEASGASVGGRGRDDHC